MGVKKVVDNFMECSSLNSLPFVVSARNRWIKFFWIFMILLGTAAMIFHLVYVLLTYLDYETTTGIKFENSNLTFPDVLICNKNAVRKSMIDNLTNAEFKSFLEAFVNASTGNSEEPIQETINVKNPFGKKKTSWYQNVRSQMHLYYGAENRKTREAVGHQIEDILLSCQFNGETCSAKDFTLLNTMDYGNCFSFNPTERIVNTPGAENGLHLQFFLQGNEFIPYLSQFGMQALISAKDTVQFPTDFGVYASSSFITRIALRENDISRLSGNYGNCSSSSIKLGKDNKTYTYHACIVFCEINYGKNVCGCIVPQDGDYAKLMKPDQRSGKCNISQTLCVEEAKEQIRNGSVSVCSECYNPCSETTYTSTISTQLWPDVYEMQSLVNFICRKNMTGCSYLRKLDYPRQRDNFASLVIFYDQMQYTTYSEAASYDAVSFASDFGGTMGLWIGISALTMVEIIYFLCCLVASSLKRLNKNPTKAVNIEIN